MEDEKKVCETCKGELAEGEVHSHEEATPEATPEVAEEAPAEAPASEEAEA